MESYDAGKLLRSFRNLLSSVSFHRFLAHVELEQKLFAVGIKFRGHAKEEAKQQPATWMDSASILLVAPPRK